MTQTGTGNTGGAKQRMRLRAALLAVVEHVSTCLFLVVYWFFGLAHGWPVPGLLAYSLVANILIVAGIGSGWSEKLKDPSMTAAQLVMSCVRDLLGCYLLPGLWFVFVFNLFVTLPFGTLQFSRRAFAAFWLATCAGLGLVLLGYPDALQIGFTGRTQKVLLWLFLSVALARLMFFNSRMTALRRKLRSNAEALDQFGKGVERERLAKEMHETVLQTFFGLVFRFTALTEKFPVGSPQRQSFEAALLDAEVALAQGRDQVSGLGRVSGGEWTLVQALRQAGRDQSYDTGLNFQMDVSGDDLPLQDDARSAVEAIVRQALANAFQHSGGQKVWLDLGFSPGRFTASVRDDGRGLPGEATKDDAPGHRGVHFMQERAETVGGDLSIVSRSPGCTQVLLRIPGHRAYDLPLFLLPAWLRRH